MSGLVHSQVTMVLRPAWAQWLCEVVSVAVAVVRPTMVTPEGREGWGDEGTIWSYFFVYLRRCGDGPLRPEG